MPISVVEANDLMEGMIVLPERLRLHLDGVGGTGHIIAIIPNMIITLGCRIETCTIGVIDSGNFDLLMGNDINSKLKV